MGEIKLVNTNYTKPESTIKLVNTDYTKPVQDTIIPTRETSDGIPTVTIQEKSTPTQAPAWQDVFEGVVGIKEAKKQELPQIPFETTSTPDPYSSYTLTTRGKQVFGEGAKQTKKEAINQSQDKGDPYLAVYKNQIRKIGIDPDQEYTPSAFIQLKKQENLSNVNQLKSDIESGNSISGKQNPTQEDEMTAISERVSEELSPIKQEKLNLFNKITENNNFIKSLQAQKTPSEEVITEEELKSIDDTINKVKKENEILSKKYQDLDTDSKLITSYFEKPTLKRGITYQTFQNNPEELLKLDETKVLYGALEDYLNSNNISDNTLRRAKLLNATTLRDGTKLFDVLTKPTWTKNEYEEIYSLLNIKPEELQKEASQSIDAVTNLMKEDIYKQGKQLSVYKNLPKNYLNDKIQSGEITEEEAKQFIQEYTSQVDNFNKKIASLNRVEEIQNKYFKDLKRFQAFKEYQDEISKKFNFNQDIVGALREGTVDNVIDAIDFANKEKATIEAKLGVITPEQELAKYLQIGTSRDYDYMRYTPDYIKNMQFLEVNPETEEKSINWRALGHSAIKTTAESYMLYLTGLGISKAAQLQRLSKYGKVGEFVSEHAGIIPASELYIQPDMFDEALQKYENGEISLSQLRSLSEMQAGIEGVTELWFMPEAKALKGVLNTGSKELALNVFLKSATGKELVNTFGKAATKAAWEGTKTGLGESWEEVLGNTFNDIYNYQVKLDNPDYKYTIQNTLENNLNTVVNTFISMYPTILLGAGQTYASNKSSAATQASLYEVAQNPSEFYKYAKDFIENTNNLEWYFPTLTKKEVLNKVAETNNKLADLYKQALPITSKLDNESDKIDYFNSLNIVNTLTPALRSKKEDELLEEAVQKIQKYTANIAYQDSLKAKDPLKFLAYKVENGLENYEYDSKDPIKLSIIGKSLFNSLQEFQNKPGYEKLVKKIEEKIDLVNKNIELANKIEVSQEQQPLISEPLQKESVNLFEQETQKLDSLSKEDIESYKVPKEITDKEERKQLTLQRLQKLQEFENKENEVLGFQRNQKVQLLSDKNTDKYYTIQGEENGRLLLKADFDGVTETTKVSPEDITPFTPKALKEETVVETTPTKQDTKEVESIEAKKADIERRRQEELKSSITNSDNIIWGHPTIGKSFLKEKGDNRFITLDDDYADEVNTFIDKHRGNQTRQEYKGSKPKEYNDFMLSLFDRLKIQAKKEGKKLFVSNTNILKERMSEFDKVINLSKAEFKKRFDKRGSTYGFEDWKSDIDETINKITKGKIINTEDYLSNLFESTINAKYDAELAALEKPVEEEEVIEQVPLSSAIAAFGEPIKTNPEDIIADVEEQIKQQEEKQDKENTKTTEVKLEQKYGRFHPWATVPYSLDKPTDVVINTAINTYNYLFNLSKESGKPFSELGYYITIFDVRDFDNSLFPKETQDYWLKNEKRGQVAVITDEKGKILKFSEIGKPDNENGLWAMQWFNASIQMPKFEGNNKELQEEKWLSDKAKLDALRANVSINKPITLTIQDVVVSSQYSASEEKPISLQFTEIPFINIGRPTTITTSDGITHNIQSGKTKIGEELANSIYDFLNVNNTQEGLPEAFYPKSDSYEDKLTAFHNRLSFGVSQKNKDKTFPEIIFYTQNGIRMFRLESNGTPSLYIRGKTLLTKEEIVKYISENEMNISYYLNSLKDQSKPILTVYSLKDNKFEAKEIPYQRFIADNFKIAISTNQKPKFNPYLTFGESVQRFKKSQETTKKEEKVEQKPDLQQPQKQEEKKLPTKKVREKKGNTLDDTLLRHILLPSKGTKSQQSTAKEWFDNYITLTGANYQDLRAIYNSTARATWTKSAITLYKTSVYTDLYHEAFHDFTQLYLTPEQKISLYKEALETKEGKQAIEKEKKRLNKETLSPLEEYHAIEELLAEDFLNYMLSEQKLILNQRPKRNTIFRKIYNFLKSLFGVNPSIQEVYERLASNKPIKAKRDPANALFGKLNSSYDQLSIRDSIALTKALDGLLAQRVINGNYSISKIFLEKGFIDKVYNSVYNDLLDSYSNLEVDYESADENRQAEIQYTLNNLDYLLDNWNEIIKKHKDNSEYLKVSKDFLPENLDEDGNEIENNTEKFDDAKENINPMDDVAQHIKFLIASLPKHEWKGGKKVPVSNSFLPIVRETVNFGDAKNLLAEKLQGVKDYDSIFNKVKELSQKHPEFEQLLKALPLPEKSLDFYELQLKNSFVNAFSKPFRYLKTTNFEYSPQGTKVISRNAQFTTVKKLKDDWTLSIQEVDNPYRITEESGQKSIDIPKILEDFKTITKNNSEDFLQAIGFVFSTPTKNSQDYLDIINLKDNTLREILNSLKSYNLLQQGKYPKDVIPTTDVVNKLQSPVYSLTNILDRNLKSSQYTLFSAPRPALDKLINLELTNSEKYHTDNVSNAENNNQWIPKNWSLQSLDAAILNNVDKYPTYSSLIASKEGSYWNIDLNPDANNLILHSLFDLDPTSLTYQQRRTKSNGSPVTLELFDQNGVIITNEASALRDGTKTSKLTRFMALVADFPVFLSTGEKQHPRYGDKSTSIGSLMEYPSFVKGNVKTNKHLPVDIKDFNTDKISGQAWFIFRNQLISALQITNDFYSDVAYQHTLHITKNIQNSPFGLFDLILTKETQQALASITSKEPVNVSDLVDRNKELILKDLSEFFTSQTKLTLNEFSFNEIAPNDFLPQYLLDNYSFEQLVKAFTVNTWIYNAEHIRNEFQDLRFYKQDKRYAEPFKRFSKSTSTGLLSVNDEQNNEFFNNPSTGSFAEKRWYDENHTEKSLPYVETGVANTIIIEDVKFTPTNYANQLLERIKKAPQDEIDAVKAKLKDLELTDAMAFCTFDFYRNLTLSQGKEEWNGEKEALYQKLARREALTPEEETSAYLFFPPLKQRVAGRTFDETTKKYIPIDYKFAITPLVPTTIKGKNFEAIRDNMIRQNVGLALFGTAAKHSAILNSNNEFNKFYESPGVPYTGDYTINPVPIESFFEVVKQPSKYKEEVRFSTQLRTLLFVNLFENGVPLDYSKANNKTKEDWDKLTEQEKLASSPSYKRAKDFSDAIDNIVKIKKDSLLIRLKATYNPTTDSYTIDEEQLSKILEEEFNKRGLPLNVINSIQLKDGKFKYPFDATIARNSIEDVLLSLIDNQLRKQDVHGEALIQVANSGFEEIGTDKTLPFYDEGAHKVKIALQGNFELLLQHPDVLTLSSKDKITPLQALNTLIKDEDWLNKSNHRELISLGSVRIPVQGLNSMEFLEVYEFLPKEAGSIVVVSPALVAKSGSDFDWDKLTTLFPNIFYNSFTKELKLYNVKDIKLTNEEALKELKKQKNYPKEKINSLYKIRNELKEELETYKQERDLAKESKIDFLRHLRFLDIEIALFRQQLDLLEEAEFAFKNEDDLKVISDLVESTIGEIGVLQGIESAIEATKNKIKERVNQANIEREFLVKSLNESISSSRENIAYSRKEIENIDKTINSVKSYLSDIQELIYKASAEKAYQNSLIKIMREVLEDPNNFVNLMLPNDTYMFEPNADKRRAAKNEGKKAGYSLVPSVVENLNQHEANFVGKDALGIAALYNKMLPQLQKVGMYLNNTYISNTIFGTTRNTTNRFKHNEIDINGTPHISISGVYSVPNLNGDKFKISEAISQIMNGTVDVAKKPWIFDLNIKKEFIATQLYHLLQGTHKDDVMAFFNQPSLDIYLRNLQNYKNPLLKALNSSKSKQAKAYAILSVLEEYGNELSNIRIDLGTIKKPNVKSIPEIIEILKEHLDDNKPQQFYGVVNKFRDLADAHPSLFNQKDYNFYKFAFPEEDGKIAKPTTEEDKLAQVLYLIQYLELDEQNSKFQNVMKTTNQDTKKMGSVQLSLKRLTDLYQTQFTDLLPSHLVDKMINEGYTKAFTHEESGIDSFISQISKQLFELTNHKIINKFILDEFRRPFEDVVRKDYPTIRGNYIAFEDRTDDDFDSFTETIKNDFILYIYDNIVYEDGNPVIAKVRKQMTYDSALATELEQIKINFPTLVKNNLFLSSLVRDNGNIKKGYTKPTRVNIKSLISKPTEDVSNILTEDFNTLLEFSDETYPIEKQQVIQNFAKKLAKFAFVQSGLNNSPISFAKLIPQESYGEDITEAIKAIKSLFDSKPEEAEALFTRFYLAYFRPNNPKFFQNVLKEDPDTGETYKVIPVKEETFRLKDYQDSEFPDILKKKENILSEKLKSNSSIKTFERGEAFSNPTTLYVYEQNYENKYAKGSANILIDKTSIKKAENTVPIYLYPTVDKTYSDKDLPTVSKNIDNAINEVVQKFKTGNYKEIAFPENLTEISKLEQSSPQSFSLLANTLKEQFGISIKNAKFEEINQMQSIEEIEPKEEITITDTFQTENEEVNLQFKVEVVKRYSVEDVKNNPNKLYIFGDNTQKQGKGGQAIIRGNRNARGIATKWKPTMEEDAFFNDEFYSENISDIKSDIEDIKIYIENHPNTTLVFPKDGLGTGLAKLKEKAPKTYQYLKDRLLQEFNFNNDTGEIEKDTNTKKGCDSPF